MGWKGTVRSVGAAMRAADREAKRRQRELERQQREYDKMEAAQQAAHEVAQHENYIELITSLHKDCSQRIDWRELGSRPAPTEPVNEGAAKAKAAKALAEFKPGAITKLVGGEERKRKKLKAAIETAKQKDLKKYRRAHENWQSEMADWQKTSGLAKRILEDDPKAKMEAVREFNAFAEISQLGSNVNVVVKDTGAVEATVNVHGKDVIPDEVKTQLQSGRLSVKKMPKGKFNELHQDYVCSCVLRVANELFSLLPDELVFVTATDQLLNSATGHLEDLPIVSACITRKTLDSLNLNQVDPSDSLSNFVHSMVFKKTQGFGAVEQLDSGQIQPTT